MAYGLQVTGADGIFMIDTEDAAGCVLGSVTAAPVAISAGASATGWSTSGNNILMAQPSATTTYGTTTNGYGLPSTNSVTTTHLRGTNSIWMSANPTFAFGTRYIILKKPGDAGSSNPNGDYGLVVYRSDGTTVIFDGRKFTRGIAVERVWDPGTLEGGWGWGSTWKSVDGQSSGTYDMSSRTIYTATGADAAAKTADMQEIFVSVASNFGASASTNNVSQTPYYNTVYYNYDEHKIFHYAYFPGFSASGVGGFADTPLANSASILVGRLIQ